MMKKMKYCKAGQLVLTKMELLRRKSWIRRWVNQERPAEVDSDVSPKQVVAAATACIPSGTIIQL